VTKGLNCGIYQVRNLVDGKRYIGSSIDLKARKSQHFSSLRRNCHFNSHLQRSFDKYGINNFVFEILCYAEKDQEYLFLLEENYISFYKANDGAFGYNMRLEANTNVGTRRSEETKLKMSLSRSGYKHSEEAKEHMRATKGHRRPFTMSFRTAEHIQHISESKKGKHPNFSDEDMQFRKERILGEKNFNARLTEKEVIQIRILLAQNFLGTEIAEKFGVNSSTIYRIRDGKIWAHLIS